MFNMSRTHYHNIPKPARKGRKPRLGEDNWQVRGLFLCAVSAMRRCPCNLCDCANE